MKLKNEITYQITMSHLKDMLDKKIISFNPSVSISLLLFLLNINTSF